MSTLTRRKRRTNSRLSNGSRRSRRDGRRRRVENETGSESWIGSSRRDGGERGALSADVMTIASSRLAPAASARLSQWVRAENKTLEKGAKMEKFEMQGYTVTLERDDQSWSPDEHGDEDAFLIAGHRQFTIRRDGFSLDTFGS